MSEMVECDSADRLKALMAAPVTWRPAKRNRAPRERWFRDVYRGHGTNEWWITYGRELPYSGPFNAQVVAALVQRGELVPTYRDCSDCYSLPGQQAALKEPA